MQNLKYPWIVGHTYKFQHPDGYWRGEVLIRGYSKKIFENNEFRIIRDGEENDGWNAMEVEILNAEPLDLFASGRIVELGADAKWAWEEINVDLENK